MVFGKYNLSLKFCLYFHGCHVRCLSDVSQKEVVKICRVKI